METINVKAQKERERLFRDNDTPYGEHVKNKKNRWFNEIELHNVADFLGATPGCSVLDICCADGRFLEYLANKGPKCALYGSDFARNPLKALHKRHIHSHAFCCDACTLSVKSSSVSRTASMQSFHHIPSHEERLKALQEVHRVMTNRGKFVLTVINRATWRHQVENGIEGQLISCKELYVYLYDSTTLRSDLEQVGFKVKTIVGINSLPNRFLYPLKRAAIPADILITRFFPALSLKKGTYILAECVKP